MNTLKRLEKMLIAGYITKEAYLELEKAYTEKVLKLHLKGLISKEELQNRLNW